MSASYANYTVMPGGSARIDDHNWESVFVTLGRTTVQLRQDDRSTNMADEIILSREGARALIDALEELL